jgi:hypothetical protein
MLSSTTHPVRASLCSTTASACSWSGALPAMAATAVINWLSVSTAICTL